MVLIGLSVSPVQLIASAGNQSYYGTNIGKHDYSRWATAASSSLVPMNSDKWMCVQGNAESGKAIISYYDSAFRLENRTSISLQLPIWGHFHSGTDGKYYLITGQSNTSCDDTVNVIDIARYDTSWNLEMHTAVSNTDIAVPFDAGCVSCADDGTWLFVHTAREMYSGHQANATLQVRMSDLEVAENSCSFLYNHMGYVSHSFAQYVQLDGTHLVTIDHGDAYPRSILLNYFQTDYTAGTFQPNPIRQPCIEVNLVPFADAEDSTNMYEVNYTGASVGGFEQSSTHYIIAYNSIDQANIYSDWQDFGDPYTRDIYIAAVPKNSLQDSSVARYKLSDYPEGSEKAQTPFLIRIGTDAFAVLWQQDNTVNYTTIDNTGNPSGNVYSMYGNLSDCQPVLKNNKLYWYTWKNDTTTLYSIDCSNPTTINSQVYQDQLAVTLDPNGGTVSPEVIYVTYHNTYSELPTPDRAGYSFDGWYTANIGGTRVTSGTYVNNSSDHTLYAHWTANTYTVNYNANTGSGSMEPSIMTYDTEAQLRKNTFTKTGYSFEKWSDGNGNYYNDQQIVKNLIPSGSKTLWVKWKPNTYTVHLNPNGGSVSSAAITVTFDSTYASLITPTRQGYSFDGWYTDETAGTKITADTRVTEAKDHTLYAHWKQNQSTITYKANGGTGSDVVQTHASGSAATLKPANTFTRKGYTFTGWNSKADGSGNTYAAGKSVSWYDNVTLYAQWKQNQSKITYKANGGSGTDVVQTHGAGSAATLKPANTFTRTGYTFTGWNSKSDGSGNTYAAGKSVSWYDNVTLYAQWKQNQSTITYKANGGSGADVVQTHGAGSKVNLKPAGTFTRSGYVFCGWNSKADGSGNTYAAGKEVAWYNNVTLYAIWKPARTITYKANGGTGADIVQTRGAGEATVLKPANTFSKSGYVFCGWNSKANGTGNTYAAGKTVSWVDNVTLYAIWKPARTITYKANGGTGADVVQTRGAGTATVLKPADTFSRSGYTFTGWNSKANGSGNTYAAGTTVSGVDNVTLYAMWKKN